MTETEVAAYREQVFGNGQSSTQPPTPPPTSITPNAESNLTAIAEPTQTVAAPIVTPNTNEPDDEIVDADTYIPQQIKENLGYESWDDAKAALAELKVLKETANTPAELKFANDQSKQLHEAILAGETDKVYEILDTQKKLSAVNEMKPADAIKLHIQQTNKNYKSVDVEDVFEEKYSYPEKPVQGDTELDGEFSQREDKWKVAKEKIDRRIERDAASAKSELLKLSAELKLPEIQKPNAIEHVDNTEAENALKLEQQQASEFYSKLAPKDIQMVFKFNDEATKLAFDIAYEPDKESFDTAIEMAKDPKKFWGEYYAEDGSPKRTEFLRDYYAGRNINKIVSEAIVQAVNQERIRALKVQKNIGDGTQRNFTLPPVSDIDRLRQQVFGKTA
jgi:hypothetical protein